MFKLITGAAVALVILIGVPLLIGLVFGSPFLIAWLADIIYSDLFETPTSNAPQISYWYWVGIVFLFSFVTGRLKVERKSA